jgi:transcriptional regulator with XRE-family HTH domain
MKKKTVLLLPKQHRILKELGENIKLARLRRKLSTIQVSKRANIARQTLWGIENGSSAVSIGAYLQVLFVLGLEKDLVNVAKDDELGRKLQDSKLIVKERAPKKGKSQNTNDTKKRP